MVIKSSAPGTIEARSSGTYLSLALLIVAACCITLPFIYKAFHLDDTVFIWLGQEKLKDPLALGLPDHGFEGNFFSLYIDTHPPLLASYLSLLLWIFGGATEAGMHIGFLVFPVLAAVSMYFLAARFTDSPLVSALLLIVTPGFMVMSQSVMTDVPALSFWLAAIAAYIYAVDRGSNRLLILAAVFISLAMLTTYQSFSLLPLLLLYAILKGRVSMKNLAPLVVALLVFGALVVFFFLETGGPPKFSYSIGIITDPAFIAKKILAIVSVLGGAVVFPVFLATGLLKGRKDYLAFAGLVLFLLVFILSQIAAGQYSVLPAVLQVVFFAVGLLVLYRFLNEGSDAAFNGARSASDNDSVFLVVWIGGVLLYNLALLPYASTRYLLPLFPPVVLMFVRYARGVITEARKWKLFAVGAVIFTAISGLAVSVADYQLSNVYRDFASTDARELSSEGRNIWYAGEFGLRYYLEANGGRYITRQGDQPAPGDYVVLSHGLIAYFISDDLKDRLQYDQSIEYPGGWPVRVEDPDSQAGFYDQFHGNLPWSISSGPVESIDIYTVK